MCLRYGKMGPTPDVKCNCFSSERPSVQLTWINVLYRYQNASNLSQTSMFNTMLPWRPLGFSQLHFHSIFPELFGFPTICDVLMLPKFFAVKEMQFFRNTERTFIFCPSIKSSKCLEKTLLGICSCDPFFSVQLALLIMKFWRHWTNVFCSNKW